MVRRFFKMTGLLLAACLSATLTLAEPLAQPEGPVLLTVGGAIAVTNSPEGAAFDLAMLEAIGVETVETTTIWTEGSRKFEGVSLAALVKAVEAKGQTLRLTALNEYAVEMPLTEAAAGGPILAYRMDGVALSPRDKGPLWMIYPFDTKPEYQNEVSYSRAVWQLHRLEILP